MKTLQLFFGRSIGENGYVDDIMWSTFCDSIDKNFDDLLEEESTDSDFPFEYALIKENISGIGFQNEWVLFQFGKGKEGYYSKLDPQSANAMPPQEDEVIDKQVEKAKTKPELDTIPFRDSIFKKLATLRDKQKKELTNA